MSDVFKGLIERMRDLMVWWKMREGGQSAKAEARGQSKAQGLELRQRPRATLSTMKQADACLFRQKRKSEPAGAVSWVLFMQTAPSPLQGPL